MLLVGDSAVTTQGLATKALDLLPEFIPLDLLNSYVLGERKRIYKSRKISLKDGLIHTAKCYNSVSNFVLKEKVKKFDIYVKEMPVRYIIFCHVLVLVSIRFVMKTKLSVL